MLYEVITRHDLEAAIRSHSHAAEVPADRRRSRCRCRCGAAVGESCRQCDVEFRIRSICISGILINDPVGETHAGVVLRARRAGDIHDRITSYNVCYTKLLRVQSVICFLQGSPTKPAAARSIPSVRQILREPPELLCGVSIS